MITLYRSVSSQLDGSLDLQSSFPIQVSMTTHPVKLKRQPQQHNSVALGGIFVCFAAGLFCFGRLNTLGKSSSIPGLGLLSQHIHSWGLGEWLFQGYGTELVPMLLEMPTCTGDWASGFQYAQKSSHLPEHMALELVEQHSRCRKPRLCFYKLYRCPLRLVHYWTNALQTALTYPAPAKANAGRPLTGLTLTSATRSVLITPYFVSASSSLNPSL